MNFFKQIINLIQFMSLPKKQRRITFYSEGKNFWPHLEGLVKELLKISDIPICYISSQKDDPGLTLSHKNYKTFMIDEGFVRNWLFENIDTDIMVMTMPDIEHFQLKRSKHSVHYVYVQHSLVSLHAIYRKGAFDYYDTIFCSGAHHMKEIRAMEKKYNLPKKNLLAHGYGRLDAIIKEAKNRPKKNKSLNDQLHVLVAPSWGPSGIIETGLGENIIDELMINNYQVTLRPHPRTIKFAKNKIDLILKKYQGNNKFEYEKDVSGQDSFYNSDVMVSDWSGAALEYAFGLSKPVIFMDIPNKINNPDYKEIDIEPIEVSIREKIGAIVCAEKRIKIPNLKDLINKKQDTSLDEIIFNVGKSHKEAKWFLKKLIQQK